MVQRDKTLHLLVGVCFAAVVSFLCGVGGLSQGACWCIGAASATALGIGKELWDSYHPPHVADAMDAVATTIGGAIGATVGSLLL